MAIKLTPLVQRLLPLVIDNHNAGLTVSASARQLEVSRNRVETILTKLPAYIRLMGEEAERAAKESTTIE